MDNLTSTAPERIWITPSTIPTEGEPVTFPTWKGKPAFDQCLIEDEPINDMPQVPYIRADLAGSWKPIAEMPEELKMNGNVDLFADGARVPECFFDDGDWYDNHTGIILKVTHWMPLPPAPQAEAEEGE